MILHELFVKILNVDFFLHVAHDAPAYIHYVRKGQRFLCFFSTMEVREFEPQTSGSLTHIVC